jgi:hypothetical protein
MTRWLTWQNILRSLAFMALVAIFVTDYLLDAFAKPISNLVYLGLIAVVLGVDIPALRGVILRLLGGDKQK